MPFNDSASTWGGSRDDRNADSAAGDAAPEIETGGYSMDNGIYSGSYTHTTSNDGSMDSNASSGRADRRIGGRSIGSSNSAQPHF